MYSSGHRNFYVYIFPQLVTKTLQKPLYKSINQNFMIKDY